MEDECKSVNSVDDNYQTADESSDSDDPNKTVVGSNSNVPPEDQSPEETKDPKDEEAVKQKDQTPEDTPRDPEDPAPEGSKGTTPTDAQTDKDLTGRDKRHLKLERVRENPPQVKKKQRKQTEVLKQLNKDIREEKEQIAAKNQTQDSRTEIAKITSSNLQTFNKMATEESSFNRTKYAMVNEHLRDLEPFTGDPEKIT